MWNRVRTERVLSVAPDSGSVSLEPSLALASHLAALILADPTFALPMNAEDLAGLEGCLSPSYASALFATADVVTYKSGPGGGYTYRGTAFEESDPLASSMYKVLHSGARYLSATTISSLALGDNKGNSARSNFFTGTRVMPRILSPMLKRLFDAYVGDESKTDIMTMLTKGNGLPEATSTQPRAFIPRAVRVRRPASRFDTFTSNGFAPSDYDSGFGLDVDEKGHISISYPSSFVVADDVSLLTDAARLALWNSLPSLNDPNSSFFTSSSLGIADSNARGDILHRARRRKSAAIAYCFALLPRIVLDALFERILQHPTLKWGTMLAMAGNMPAWEAAAQVTNFHVLPPIFKPYLDAVSVTKLGPQHHTTADARAYNVWCLPHKIEKLLYTIRAGKGPVALTMAELAFHRSPIPYMADLAWGSWYASDSPLSSPSSTPTVLQALLNNRTFLHDILRGTDASSAASNLVGYTYHELARLLGWSSVDAAPPSNVITPETLVGDVTTHNGIRSSRPLNGIHDFLCANRVTPVASYVDTAAAIAAASKPTGQPQNGLTQTASLLKAPPVLDGETEPVAQVLVCSFQNAPPFYVPRKTSDDEFAAIGMLVQPRDFVLMKDDQVDGMQEQLWAEYGDDYRIVANTAPGWASRLGVTEAELLGVVKARHELWSHLATVAVSQGSDATTKVEFKGGYAVTSTDLARRARSTPMFLPRADFAGLLMYVAHRPYSSDPTVRRRWSIDPFPTVLDSDTSITLEKLPSVLMPSKVKQLTPIGSDPTPIPGN